MKNQYALQTGALSTEMQLLLALLTSSDIDELPAALPHLFQRTNWDTFIQLAVHHRVYPYLYHKLKCMKEEWIPSSVIHRFHRDYRKNTFQMLHLSGEMEIIGNELSAHNIRSLFLKGPVIAEDLYGDISLRTSCDLDLILPMRDLFRAEELLVQLGYVKDDYIRTVLNDWKWRHHHTIFYHPGKGIKVEIHWRLNPAPTSEPSFEELWNRRRRSGLISSPIYYLGREDLFLFLVSHGARHGWSRLRWLLDIRQLLLQQPDAVKLTALLHKHHYAHVGGQTLILASVLLKASIDPALQELVLSSRARRLAHDTMFYLERTVNLHTIPVPEEVQQYHKRYMFLLLTVRQRLIFMLSFLFPYPEDADTLPLPKSLHVLYIPLRPLLWAWRKTVGVRG